MRLTIDGLGIFFSRKHVLTQVNQRDVPMMRMFGEQIQHLFVSNRSRSVTLRVVRPCSHRAVFAITVAWQYYSPYCVLQTGTSEGPIDPCP